MTKQNNILAKYDSVKLENQTTSFITIPRKLVNVDIPVNEKGLFIQLLLESGISPITDYHYVLKNQTISSIVHMIFWKKENKRINSVHVKQTKELLEQLKEHRLIKISEYQDDRFDIILPTAKNLREGDDGFVKLYADSLKKIVAKSSGIQRLKNLLFYAAVRSRVFENYQQQVVVTESPNYFAKLTKISETVAKNRLKWMRDNEVLAYFKAERANTFQHEKYYYADMHDAGILTDVVKGYLEQGVIKEVLE